MKRLERFCSGQIANKIHLIIHNEKKYGVNLVELNPGHRTEVNCMKMTI